MFQTSGNHMAAWLFLSLPCLKEAKTPVRQVGQPAVHGPAPRRIMTIKVDSYPGWASVKQDWKFYARPAWRSK